MSSVDGPAPSGAEPGPPAGMLLVRHGPTRWNEQQRRQGWSGPGLSPQGRALALRWARETPWRFGALVSSDLSRAVQTAEIVRAVHGGGPVQREAGLREQHQGAWTGLTKTEIKARWPGRLKELPRRPVEGEPAGDVLVRVLAALHAIAARWPGERLLVVTHSDVIRIVERALGGEAPTVPHLTGRWLLTGGAEEPLTLGPMSTGREPSLPAASAPAASAGP